MQFILHLTHVIYIYIYISGRIYELPTKKETKIKKSLLREILLNMLKTRGRNFLSGMHRE